MNDRMPLCYWCGHRHLYVCERLQRLKRKPSMTLTRLFLLLTLTTAILSALFAVSVRLSGATPPGWTAAGCSAQDWQGEPLGVTAYSCGLLYDQSFSASQPLALEARVRCMPAVGDKCWGGIKIGNISPTTDDDALCEYGNLNVAWHVWSPAIEEVASLVNCSPRHHGPYTPGTWRTLKIVSEPAGAGYVYYSLILDGALQARVRAAASGSLTPKLECVAANPNTPSDGSLAHCEFGDVAITQPGDANCSGAVDGNDSLVILRWVSGLGPLQCPQNADVNCDGQVDAVDSLLIQRYVAGLGSVAC